MTRRRVLSILGTLLAAALAVWMVWRIDDKAALLRAFRDALGRPGWLALGIGLLGVSLLAGTIRWWMLLVALKTPLPFRETLRLYLAGHFCSIFATGSTGGDVVKAAIVAARFPGRRIDAVSSILVERLVGFSMLFVPVCGAYCLLDAHPFPGFQRLLGIALWSGLALFLFLVLEFPVFLPNWQAFIMRRGFYRRNPRLQMTLRPVFRIWENARGFFLDRYGRSLDSSICLLSILNHVVAALCGVALVRATGAEVPFLAAATAMLLANVAAIVPLTPGGVGLREATAMGLLCLAGATEAQATAAGFLVFGVTLVWAAVGAVSWFALRRR